MDTNESALSNNVSQQPKEKELQTVNKAPKQNNTAGFTEPDNQTRSQDAIDIETEKPAREGRATDSENIETGGPDKPTA